MKSIEENLELMRRYLTGEADAEVVKLLGDRLKVDAVLRRDFLAYARVDAALAAMPAKVVPVKNTRWRVWAPLTAAAAMLAAMGLAWIGLPFGARGEPIATLVATTNARWADPNVELALSSGGNLPVQLQLESGRAEFRMVDGARIALQGPATVSFTQRKVVSITEGRVFCECPTPESRITIETPQTTVVDLGTEFTVDARADQSTRVAVLSGQVNVLAREAGVLMAGEVVEVRQNHVVRLQPLTPEEMTAISLKEAMPPSGMVSGGHNALLDSSFESKMPCRIWHGTDDCIQEAPALGRTGQAVRIRAGGKHYPLVKQRVETGAISGRVVHAMVWAMSPGDDPLSDRQRAVLKIAFLNAEGREFACSTRHSLHTARRTGEYVPMEIAASAPAGTHSIEVQLLLAASTLRSGSVCFDDAVLLIVPDQKP